MILKAGFVLLLASAIPASATSAYMITTEDSITHADEFGTINLSTGAFTLLGNTDVGGNPADPETLSGLGEVGSVLYGEAGGTLYSINTANGDLTAIGTGTQEFYEFGSTLTGLYGVSSSNGDLYSVSTTDGSMTQVGPGPGFGGGSASLSTGSSTLYFTVFNGDTTFTLSTRRPAPRRRLGPLDPRGFRPERYSGTQAHRRYLLGRPSLGLTSWTRSTQLPVWLRKVQL